MKIKWHRYLLNALLGVVAFAVRFLPLDAASKLGGAIGGAVYFLLPHERKKTQRHLTRVFGKEKNLKEIRCIARKVFVNLGRNLGEWLKMPYLSDRQILDRVEAVNFDRVEEALSKGKGLIILTGHFGNWEWLAAYFGSLGYEGRVLARRIYFEPYNRRLIQMRLAHRIETIFRDESPKRILKLLSENKVLGILPDQDVDKINGIFIPFFGMEALTPTAPVNFALSSGAALVPAFIVREGSKFKLHFEDPVPVTRTENKQADLRRHTLEWSGMLEKYIRRYPDHWVWMHRRWKTRPETTGKTHTIKES